MSAIKRFFSGHKTSATAKVHHANSTNESPIVNSKSVLPTPAITDKIKMTNETVVQTDHKENLDPPPFPSSEIPLKSRFFNHRSNQILLTIDSLSF